MTRNRRIIRPVYSCTIHRRTYLPTWLVQRTNQASKQATVVPLALLLATDRYQRITKSQKNNHVSRSHAHSVSQRVSPGLHPADSTQSVSQSLRLTQPARSQPARQTDTHRVSMYTYVVRMYAYEVCLCLCLVCKSGWLVLGWFLVGWLVGSLVRTNERRTSVPMKSEKK